MRRKVKLEDLVPGAVILHYEAQHRHLVVERVDLDNNKVIYTDGAFDYINEYKSNGGVVGRYEIEQSTFDDVKDLVYKAFKDKVVTDLAMSDSKISFKDLDWVQHEIHDNGNPEHVIKYVKSLYKDKFLIESEEDYHRIKGCASAILLNGEVLSRLPCGRSEYKDRNGRVVKLSFCVLKGATIVQERG